MKILFDTNVVLDLLMDREPFAEDAAALFAAAEHGVITGYLGGATVTTVHYLTARVLGPAQARAEIGKLMTLFEIAPVTRSVLESALNADFGDFEDSVLHEAARHAGAEVIVTRNGKDFRKAAIPVYAPAELLKALLAQGKLEE